MPSPQQEVRAGSAYLSFRTDADGSTIEVLRREVICADTMTGMPYPHTVTLIVDDRILHGCGGDPLTLLIGDAWRTSTIDGVTVAEDMHSSIVFTTDGVMYGDGPCNRFNARYDLSGEGMTVHSVATTRIACQPAVMAQEEIFLSVLTYLYRFEVRAGNNLVLHATNGRSLSAAR